MKIKNWLINSFLVFITFEILNFLIHSIALSKQYAALMHLWRPDMMSKMWVMNVANAIFALIFVYIFSKGYEKKGIVEGVRYGLLLGLMIQVFNILGQYAVYPVPFILAAQWLVFGVLQITICGVVLSFFYNKFK